MFATFAPMILWFAHTIAAFAPMIAAFALGIFSKTHQSSLTLNEGFFLKSPREVGCSKFESKIRHKNGVISVQLSY